MKRYYIIRYTTPSGRNIECHADTSVYVANLINSIQGIKNINVEIVNIKAEN